MDIAEIKTITRNDYKQPYANKSGNLKEMDRFPDTCNLPKLSDEDRKPK